MRHNNQASDSQGTHDGSSEHSTLRKLANKPTKKEQ